MRSHLLIWLLGALSLGAVVLAGASYAFTLEELNEVFDNELKQVALAALTHHHDGGPLRAIGPHNSEFVFFTQVWSDDGTRVFESASVQEIPLIRESGLQTVSALGRAWRVYTVHSGARYVQAAQPLEVRQRLAASTASKLLIPSMLIVPLVALLLTFALRRGLAPLTNAAADVGRRSALSLDPIPDAALPQEIRPLVGSINALMQRLSIAFASQRRFIADAAHELRTPLTALRLQLQLVEGAQSESARAAALLDLKQGLARATRLVEQLLDLSRLDPDGAKPQLLKIDLACLARAVVGELSVKAEAKDIDLGADAETPAVIEGDETRLRLLVGNLVDNAIRYTPPNGRIDVKVYTSGERALLEVSDTGPGIPTEERDRVFDRFYRATNVRKDDGAVPGTGLGLSIVKTVATHHRAGVCLLPGISGHGLTVRVDFPRSDSDSGQTEPVLSKS